MLAIDLKATFDSVWHQGLIHKLSCLSFPLHIVRLVQSYLENRSFQVRIGSSMSSRFDIKAGVPQGAVWAPVLFNIYIHELPCPKDVTIAQFAEDTAVIAQSKRTSTVVNRLQRLVT